jgi:hypothetical protein
MVRNCAAIDALSGAESSGGNFASVPRTIRACSAGVAAVRISMKVFFVVPERARAPGTSMLRRSQSST